MTGQDLISWTIWAALGLYAASVVVALWRPAAARDLFTMSWLAYVAHVVAVFQFFHGWSHTSALENTAKRTEEVTGTPFGAGVYINYAFSALWTLEVLWWWFARASYERRSRWLHAFVHLVFVFMIFHSTVVFGVGDVRWYGGAVTAVVLLASVLSWRRRARCT